MNNNNGARLETYVIEGSADSGVIYLNGDAARFERPGNNIIIISYCWLDEKKARTFKAKVVFVEANNKILKICDKEIHWQTSSMHSINIA